MGSRRQIGAIFSVLLGGLAVACSSADAVPQAAAVEEAPQPAEQASAPAADEIDAASFDVIEAGAADGILQQGDLSYPDVPVEERMSAGLLPDDYACDDDESLACDLPQINALALDARIQETMLDENGREVFIGEEGGAATAAEWPHTVLLLPKSRITTPICTGNLISATTVLTARHCVGGGRAAEIGSYVLFGYSFRKPGIADVRRVDAVDYPLGRESGLDLAMLRLSKPVAWAPVELATDEDLAAARRGRVAGFGYRMEFPSDSPPELHYGDKYYTDIAIASPACEGQVVRDGVSIPDADYYGCAPGRDIVAGTLQARWGYYNADTCNGDSGGPLFVPVAGTAATDLAFAAAMAPETGTYRLGGITSSAIDTRYVDAGDIGCGNGGKYTRLGPEIRQSIADIQKKWMAP